MSVRIFKCFIASPGDTIKEREACEEVFRDINKTIGEKLDFRIEGLRWEHDTRPSFGTEGQDIIDSQIGGAYDIFIGIMHLKFGSPIKSGESGTEHEFNNAYDKYTKEKKVEIAIYFNNAPADPNDIDPEQLSKVKAFKKKVSDLGGLYKEFKGTQEFKSLLHNHLSKYLLSITCNTDGKNVNPDTAKTTPITEIFEKRFKDSLMIFTDQPLIWVEPILSDTSEISQNPDDNYNRRIKIEDIIRDPVSTKIMAPTQFGLTVLSHFMVKCAWANGNLWIYLESSLTKAHNIHNAVKREVESLGMQIADIKCIILDSWSLTDPNAHKKLKNLLDAYKEIPVFVMQTIDDSGFLKDAVYEEYNVNFRGLHLLAMQRAQIRKVVSDYNRIKSIGEEDIVLKKVTSDLEALNIHRTPLNCITLLRVSEKYFDESPVNRTRMLEMVLFVLFNMDGIPTYKTKPDLKDCEYVLGRFCEVLIRNNIYEFSRDLFLKDLRTFCAEKLIDLEVELVFDVLTANNIIIHRDFNYIFRSSYWIYYFGAKRMHAEQAFADYILTNKRYTAFPEIIEFYTGIDRSRSDALRLLINDIHETCDVVSNKVGLPADMNPLKNAKWRPSAQHVEKMQEEISDNVKNSRLPEAVKDQYADRHYDQKRPYNQSIQSIFEEYSLHNLMQNIRACSRGLRNSDYVDPVIKRQLLQEIVRGWEQMSRVLFALAPILATEGKVNFQGTGFTLSGDFGQTHEEKINRILQVVFTNVVGYFKDDLFSNKIGPLLYDQMQNPLSEMTKHQLALLVIFERPRDWKSKIEEYIVSLPKDSFYLYDVVNGLRSRYRYAFVSHEVLREIEYLIKMGLAKHQFGDKKPGLHQLKRILNSNLPKREPE